MSESIIAGNMEQRCHICGRFVRVPHQHHIFGGANRKWSDKYGLWVYLCPECHNMSKHCIHRDEELMDKYHELGQEEFETRYMAIHGVDQESAREAFRKVFGRSYL